MKIAILIDRLNVGGVEKIALEEVIALRKAGHDAYLVVLRRKAVANNAFPELTKKVPVIYLDDRLPPIARISFTIPLFQFFSSFHLTYTYLIPRTIKKGEFDYIIVHGTYTAMTAARIARRHGIPFSTFIWDPASYILERVYRNKWPNIIYVPLHYFAHSLDKYLIKATDSVLVGGPAHDAFIRKISKDKRIHTIYPSVHPAKSISHKEGYALVVTAWKEGKNPEYLIDVAKALPGLKIKMAGRWVDPNYQATFEQLLHAEGVSKQIEVIGEVSEHQLAELYAKAMVLLQTNDDRGFGMPALEAAAQGTSFIIPQGQGVCELFTDKKEGFYTKEKDTATITKLLRAFIEDSQLASDMGSDALQTVKIGHSWSNHSKKLISIIKEERARNPNIMQR